MENPLKYEAYIDFYCRKVARRWRTMADFHDLKSYIWIALKEMPDRDYSVPYICQVIINKLIDWSKSKENNHSYSGKFDTPSLDAIMDTLGDLPDCYVPDFLWDSFTHVPDIDKDVAIWDLYNAINKLSERDRFIIKSLIEGYTQEDIAPLLNISRSMVSKRETFIKNFLRRKLKEKN